MTTIARLPRADGTVAEFTFAGRAVERAAATRPRTREAFAAAHVVVDPLAAPDSDGIDWDRTIAYRQHLWSLGLGVAEAMDTAQRGGGLPPEAVAPLVEKSITAAADCGGEIAVGLATDDLAPGPCSLGEIVDSYRRQLELVAGTTAIPVLMASRQLAASATSPDDYATVYDTVLGEVEQPAIIHWLGEMFDPQLAGYWGAGDLGAAADVVAGVIAANAPRVRGVKVSLLDEQFEVDFRRRLPDSVHCYTGDDFNYPALIAGDEVGFSHALLGIFDVIAEVAAAALDALADGDSQRYDALFAPTVPLSRVIFETPTFNYKTGVVFLAYLRRHQDHFRMLGGAESARSIGHLGDLVRLADAAGLFDDPDDVARRLKPVLAAAGVW